jgi:cell division protein FtsL
VSVFSVLIVISEETEITVSVKSLVAFLSLLFIFVATYFQTLEDIHSLQTQVVVLKDDLSEAQANIRELAVREMDAK